VGAEPPQKIRGHGPQPGGARPGFRGPGGTPLGFLVFGCQAPEAGYIEILHHYGTDEQKETWLRPLVEGRIRSCFSMTEVDLPSSNPIMMDTTAVKDGDDYVINGHKWYTSSADGSKFAIVMAVTDPEASPYMRASMIIVPTDTPGFNLVRNISVMGHAGESYFSMWGVPFYDRIQRARVMSQPVERYGELSAMMEWAEAACQKRKYNTRRGGPLGVAKP